ncbi:MAG TPA: hypothetical protein ACFYEF_14930 [Candidatus Wunengus sp. YC63]|uniref:hypothetical protein n=1 Tax=Candidatus Wunengus sp. YC63 TaxID=3367699 RepID=UPI00402A4031
MIIAGTTAHRAYTGILCSNRQNAFTHTCSACQCLDSSCAAAVGTSSIGRQCIDNAFTLTNTTFREVRHNAKRVIPAATAKCAGDANQFPFPGNTRHSIFS